LARTVILEQDEAKLRAAIARAEKAAPRDAARFLEELIEGYRGGPAARGRARAAARARPLASAMGTDRRYLGHARALVRGAKAGMRIVGGRPVKSGEFADCVAVGCIGDWVCTGTLIAPQAVVTAGHCAQCATRVFFGTDVDGAGDVVAVKKAVRHPSYHQGRHNDLMVLLLARPVTKVKARKLASAALIAKATDARLVGFGNTNLAGTQGYGKKRQVDVPVVSPACQGETDGEDDDATYGCDRGWEIVAGRPLLERDSCTGDSGGPLYVATAAGEWRLAGVTSRATDSGQHECGDGGVYARIDRYREWLAGVPGVALA
jgi:secreted trypsin-like serine protease